MPPTLELIPPDLLRIALTIISPLRFSGASPPLVPKIIKNTVLLQFLCNFSGASYFFSPPLPKKSKIRPMGSSNVITSYYKIIHQLFVEYVSNRIIALFTVSFHSIMFILVSSLFVLYE